MQDLIGRTLGHYRIVEKIGEGGMGEVYRAHDERLDRDVAIKVLHESVAQDADRLARFEREAKAVAKLAHPNILEIWDFGREDGVTYAVTELLDGQNLRQSIPASGMPWQKVVEMGAAIADGFAAAHGKGIVHRDLKPENVFVTSDGRVKILDFGLAQVKVPVDEEAETATLTPAGTVAGTVMGTMGYMSPEQLRGESSDARSDIFALGCVLYEMLSGQPAFLRNSTAETTAAVLKEEPPILSDSGKTLPVELERAIRRCLEKSPEARFQSTSDLAYNLRSSSTDQAIRRATPTVVTLWRKHRLRLWMAAAAATLVVASVAVWLFRSGIVEEPAPVVEVRPALAVIGFRNLGEPEADWISTALSEMLRTELAVGDQLNTVSGENVARMKVELSLPDTDSLASDTLGAVHSILGADYVVLGSYLALPGTSESALRFDWRLQDTQNGEVVRADQETGNEANLFDLVAGAGSKLRESLDFRSLTPEEIAGVRASLPETRGAARLYAEGLAKLRVFDALGARELLERAAAADPSHPLIRSALATCWSAMGYDARALEEAGLAAELSGDLPRQERLMVKGRLHELEGEWEEAVSIYSGLFVVFPDDLDNGLRLARAQVAAGDAEDAIATIDTLRQLPAPAANDPRLDLAEAYAAKTLTDFEAQRRLAVSAARTAESRGARVLYARARLSECEALVNLLLAEEASSACSEARTIFRSTGYGAEVVRADYLVAVSHAKSGEMESAAKVFDQALADSRRIGNRREIVKLLNNVGNVHSAQGRFDDAKQAYMEALDISEEIADRHGTATAWNNIAVTLDEEGHLDEAVEAYERALETFREIGAKRWVAINHYNIGFVRQLQGRPDLARIAFERSVEVNRQLGLDLDGADSLVALGEVLIEQGDVEEAQLALAEAMQWYVDAADVEGEAAVRAILERLE